MESLGFQLDADSLINDKIVRFIGRSRVRQEYPLIFSYPNGYPSFPPIVISKVSPDLILNRHHAPDTGVLCCFGFSNERWKAYFTAFEVYLEAEQLIVDYPPNGNPPVHDIVPEPRISHFDYEDGNTFLIPPPFGDMKIEELEGFFKAKLKIVRNKFGTRGILSSIENRELVHNAVPTYDEWFSKATVINAAIRIVKEPPPLEQEQLQSWLNSIGIKPNKSNESWTFIVFPDEWGIRGRYRATWILLKTIRGINKWIRCYAVNSDDREVRTPHGGELNNKNVLLVGAGSLGSMVALNLAQEGIGNITLIDSDRYEPANSIRHPVGQTWFGIPKVVAVEDRIKQVSPLTNVDSKAIYIGEDKGRDTYEEFIKALIHADVIVDTTGHHSVSHYINSICTNLEKKLVVGSVTNGGWSTEVVRYRPGKSGCWVCWNISYGQTAPPGAPESTMQFAPGCNQPTFVGAVSDINIAAALTCQMVVNTLLDDTPKYQETGGDYLVWSSRDQLGNWDYAVKVLSNDKNPSCLLCNADD